MEKKKKKKASAQVLSSLRRELRQKVKKPVRKGRVLSGYGRFYPRTYGRFHAGAYGRGAYYDGRRGYSHYRRGYSHYPLMMGYD